MYKEKYLKYKTKYLELKKQFGKGIDEILLLKKFDNPHKLFNFCYSNKKIIDYDKVDWKTMFEEKYKSKLDAFMINYAKNPNIDTSDINKEDFYYQLKQIPTNTFNLDFFKLITNSKNENFWLYYNTMVLIYLENKFFTIYSKYQKIKESIAFKDRVDIHNDKFSFLNFLLIYSIPNDIVDLNSKIDQELLISLGTALNRKIEQEFSISLGENLDEIPYDLYLKLSKILDLNRKIEQEFLISLGANLKEIPDDFFYYHNKHMGIYEKENIYRLTNITIPNTIEDIGIGAFSNNNLINVIMGNNVTNIGVDAFRNNPGLIVRNLNLEYQQNFFDISYFDEIYTVFSDDAVLYNKTGRQIEEYLYKVKAYRKFTQHN